jgi:hypothetical protein
MKNKKHKFIGVFTYRTDSNNTIEIEPFSQEWQECLENAYKRKDTYFIDHLVCYTGNNKRDLTKLLKKRLAKA